MLSRSRGMPPSREHVVATRREHVRAAARESEMHQREALR